MTTSSRPEGFKVPDDIGERRQLTDQAQDDQYNAALAILMIRDPETAGLISGVLAANGRSNGKIGDDVFELPGVNRDGTTDAVGAAAEKLRAIQDEMEPGWLNPSR